MLAERGMCQAARPVAQQEILQKVRILSFPQQAGTGKGKRGLHRMLCALNVT